MWLLFHIGRIGNDAVDFLVRMGSGGLNFIDQLILGRIYKLVVVYLYALIGLIKVFYFLRKKDLLILVLLVYWAYIFVL